MTLLSDDGKDNLGSGKTPTSSFITNLPIDCLTLIFKRLKEVDRISFGLTCRQWLHIQNNSIESLSLCRTRKKDATTSADESFPIVLCKLLSRFQSLKNLSLGSHIPEITDFVTPKSRRLFEFKVQSLSLDYCYENADIKLPLMFSWFPRLTSLCLRSSHMTDKGLEVLVKCCACLKEVWLWDCHSITDPGISFLLQNCRELGELWIISCCKITGIGFFECPKTLTHVRLCGCKLKPEGINAIVSGGGIEYLSLQELAEVRERSITTESVIAISKGCPLLKELFLLDCAEVELEGWQSVGRNCKNLEPLNVCGCKKLCDQGLKALCDGCNKLSMLVVDDRNSCSSSAIEIFKHKKPNVMCHRRELLRAKNPRWSVIF